jgi:DNA-binding transcriptional ArsR family regulator
MNICHYWHRYCYKNHPNRMTSILAVCPERTMIIFMELNVIQQQYEQQAALFKLFTHPARLAILEVLRQGEACVCHMEAVLGFRQAYISQQLAVLREGGIIQDRREGWNIYYSVRDPRVFEVLAVVENLLEPGLGQKYPSAPPQDCSCPKCSSLRGA